MNKRKSSLIAWRQWFPVELPISYEGLKLCPLYGEGRTLAMSSGGIRFACDQDLPVGLIVRVAVQWPARLDDGTCLNLSATAKIQSCQQREIEVAIVRHEFRVRRGNVAKPVLMINATMDAAI